LAEKFDSDDKLNLDVLAGPAVQIEKQTKLESVRRRLENRFVLPVAYILHST